MPASLYRTTGVPEINCKYSSLDTPSDLRDPGGIVPKRCGHLCWVGCLCDDFAPKPGACRPCPVPRPILRSAPNKLSTGLSRVTLRGTESRRDLPESMWTHVIESLLWWVLVDLARLPRPPVRLFFGFGSQSVAPDGRSRTPRRIAKPARLLGWIQSAPAQALSDRGDNPRQQQQHEQSRGLSVH